MLWNSVFEFFIKHVFGGRLMNSGGSWEEYTATIGQLVSDSHYYDGSTSYTFIKLTNGFGVDYYLGLGNYLSLIATIITMVIIVTLCSLFIWKIIKLVGGLIR